MFPDIKKKHIEDIRYPACAEIKLDGELIMWNGYDQKIINSYGTDKTGKVDIRSFPKDCTLWGEMYYGRGVNFYSEYQSHQNSGNLKVAWFDVLNRGTECLYPKWPYKVRRMALEEITTDRVPSIAVGPDTIKEVFDTAVIKGYEGVVVKATDSYLYNGWVKLKRSAMCKLYITGIRKDLKGTPKKSFAVGTAEHRYGCVGYVGWEKIILPEVCKQRIIGEDRNYWYVEPKVKIEIEYQMLTDRKHLRNPFIKRLLDSREEIVLP